MYLDSVFSIEIYYRPMLSRSLWISVDKLMYSRCNVAFGRTQKF
jgi:hypothetical protein